jgi:hypothetical protein
MPPRKSGCRARAPARRPRVSVLIRRGIKRQDRGQRLGNVDPIAHRKLADMHAEDPTKLPERLIEMPATRAAEHVLARWDEHATACGFSTNRTND